MQATAILLIAVGYVGLLFAIAYRYDREGAWPAGRPVAGAAIYAMSIGVYCTSWTFYGSVGRASASGVDFLPVYLGPTLTFCLGWPLLAKMLRVSKTYRITSIADFIASRYGKSGALAGLVTVIAVIGSIPYIALQLKALDESFVMLANPVDPDAMAKITAVVAALLLAAFAILFGTRHIDASEHHQGLVTAIAFESVVKLLCFVAIGLFVGLALFPGYAALFADAEARPELAHLFRFETSGVDWTALMLVSMAAAFCLPRQFQMIVVENRDERHLASAVWSFPLYLLLINLFVLPVALAGLLVLPSGSSPDLFVLNLPLHAGARWLAVIAFIGGLSAATSMVVVESIALSTMICNDLVMPVLLRLAPEQGRSCARLVADAARDQASRYRLRVAARLSVFLVRRPDLRPRFDRPRLLRRRRAVRASNRAWAVLARRGTRGCGGGDHRRFPGLDLHALPSVARALGVVDRFVRG